MSTILPPLINSFTKIASTGQALRQGASSQCTQTIGLLQPSSPLVMILIRDLSGINNPCLMLEHANSHIWQPVQFSDVIVKTLILKVNLNSSILRLF
jgi:hypothetical protein